GFRRAHRHFALTPVDLSLRQGGAVINTSGADGGAGRTPLELTQPRATYNISLARQPPSAARANPANLHQPRAPKSPTPNRTALSLTINSVGITRSPAAATSLPGSVSIANIVSNASCAISVRGVRTVVMPGQ